MPTFDTPQPITATVEISAGSVRLVASDRDDTVVEVRPRDESRSHDVKAAEQVRVDFTNGTLAVASQRGFSFPRRGAVVVDIALPSGSRLQRVGRIGEHHRRRPVRRLQIRLGQRRPGGRLCGRKPQGGHRVRRHHRS